MPSEVPDDHHLGPSDQTVDVSGTPAASQLDESGFDGPERVADRPTDEDAITQPLPVAYRSPGGWSRPMFRGLRWPSARWWSDLGRRLRSVAGVDEALLDRVPQERARYSALGGVVVGTALIATFSMYFAITEAIGSASVWTLVPALIWGLFIFNFDRWLISSSVGLHWHRRFGTLIMRVLMALLFGIIIAEPLVLRVFQTAIVKSVQDQRTVDLAATQSKLLACNPETAVPGGSVPPGCAGYMLTFPSTPGSLASQLASKRADEKRLSAQIATDTKQLNSLNSQAGRECVGDSGPGLTGHAGVGPNCNRLRAEADAYAKAHPIAQETAQLSILQNQISALEAQVTSAQGSFEQQRTKLINDRLATERSHQGPIGILERMDALGKLAASSHTLLLGTWAVRLLFIMVDCMPILVKFFGGVTTYDRLVDREFASADADHAAEVEIADAERAARVRRRRDEIDVEVRENRARLGGRVSRAVHDLATQFVEPDPHAPAGPHGHGPSNARTSHSSGTIHPAGAPPGGGIDDLSVGRG